MKDTDYNIMMMSTLSGLNVTKGQKVEIRVVKGEVVKLKDSKYVADHYRYRGAAYKHNA